MKKFASPFLILFCALLFLQPVESVAQDKSWETMWIKYGGAQGGSNPSYDWMIGTSSFTGLAYDKRRDYLYITSPKSDQGVPTPNIFIWNASTGDTIGRLRIDRSVVYGGFSQGVYAVFKVQVSDSGEIFVSNLVSPIWGICLRANNTPGPPCEQTQLLNQGPWRLYKWNTPTSLPKLAYSTPPTVDTNFFGGTMTYTRWGDVLSVIGTRDSMRVFTSGGDPSSRAMSSEFDVLTPLDASADTFGITLRAQSSINGFASHGIAPESKAPNSPVWVDNNVRVTGLQSQQGTPISIFELPPDVTDSSGTVRYFEVIGRKYLAVCDGVNRTGFFNTRGRLIDVTNRNATFVEGPPTPPIGNKGLTNLSGTKNWVNDVSYRLDGLRVWLYVLMSNNGIAAYRANWTLPVEMSSLKADIVGDEVRLNWFITQETFNYGWQVQRSLNAGSDWENIGFVAGRGTTNEEKEYTYRDPLQGLNPNFSEIRYRLKQIDTDGAIHYSPVVHVLLGSSPRGLELGQNYPNPFNPTTTFTYSLDRPGFVTVRLLNGIGQQIRTLAADMKDSGTHLVSVDASDLAAGTYYYQVSALGKTMQKKMVVLK